MEFFQKIKGALEKKKPLRRHSGKRTEEQGTSEGRWNAALLLAFVIGFFFLIYPSAADYWNNFHQYHAIMEYADQVARMSPDEYAAYIRAAHEYNERLAQSGINWNPTEEALKEYESILAFNRSGSMGYIDIPKIRVKLPIYHGTEDTVLEVAIGHIMGSSLPVGGESSHAVLTAHRGLPAAKLFTDLDQLVLGDRFYVKVLDQTLAYEVENIEVVAPTETRSLAIQPGQDLVTLVTCTPYGVNTDRLLVRGHRVPYEEAEEQKAVAPHASALLRIAVQVACVLLGIALAYGLRVLLSRWHSGGNDDGGPSHGGGHSAGSRRYGRPGSHRGGGLFYD